MKPSITTQKDTKKVFRKLGTCSQTFFHLLNREFDQTKETEERAADPLAGGIMQNGQQCGMLWGSSLAIGTTSFNRCKDHDKAIGLAISTTQHVVASFENRAEHINCRDITKCKMNTFLGMTKFMLKTTLKGMENSTCFNLAEEWAPEAIQAANEKLAQNKNQLPQKTLSCASEVAKKMGGNDEEMVTVAGFAGGLGLSGHACGALSAAIWMKSLDWSRKHPGKSSWKNQNAKKILKTFKSATGDELLCHKICGQRFEQLEDHTEFIKNGGCKELINTLSKS